MIPSCWGSQPLVDHNLQENGDADSDASLPVRNAAWKPPAGSWEDHIAQLDAGEDEEYGKLMVYLTRKNGHKTQYESSVIYQRWPLKVGATQCFFCPTGRMRGSGTWKADGLLNWKNGHLTVPA